MNTNNKKILKLIRFLLIIITMFSCSSKTPEQEQETASEPKQEPDSEEIITLEINPLSHQFDAEKQLTASFTVKSNRTFTVSSSQEWCTSEIIPNKKTDNLKISVTKNEDANLRTAIVTIMADTVSASIAIDQSGNPVLSTEESSVYVTGSSQEFTLHLTTNFPVVFEIPSWIRQKNVNTPVSGGIYTFIVDELSTAIDSRRDTLVIKAENPEIAKILRIPVVQMNVTTLNVMTFNIYLESGSKLRWANRRASMVKIIRLEDIDILGTQETEYSQHSYLKINLTEYAAYGVGREDGKSSGEHNTIFYKKGRFIEHGSGTFWLNETPDKPGKGWDAGYTRIASWVKLEDKISGKRMFVINTHIDHIGPQAQYNSIRLLMEKIHELHGDLPVILTGDFNMPPANDNIKYITDTNNNPYYLVHTKDVAVAKEGNSGTYHDLSENDSGPGWFIDFIFVSENTEVLYHKVFPPKIDDIYLSDHSPVMAKILLP